MEAQCVLHIQAIIGESPRWSESDQALYWVDIHGKTVNRFDPVTKAFRTWLLHERIGCFSFTRSGLPTGARAGRIIAGMQSGIFIIDLETMQVERRFELAPADPTVRFNDGRCDAGGRFWAGTLREGGTERAGVLYRYDPDGRCTRMVDGLIIPNGLAFSPDHRTLYHSDSRQDYVFAWDFDVSTGGISNRRIFIQNDIQEGRPDGAVVDCEGGYWIANVGGWRVSRYTPDGRIDRVVGIPVQRPTACTLGGADFKTLFVTTASHPLADAVKFKQPLAGSVFAVPVEVPGLPEATFNG